MGKIMRQDEFDRYVRPLREAELVRVGEGVLYMFSERLAPGPQAALKAAQQFLDGLTDGERAQLIRIGCFIRGRERDIVTDQVQSVALFVEDVLRLHMDRWHLPLQTLIMEIKGYIPAFDLQSVLALIALELFRREWEE